MPSWTETLPYGVSMVFSSQFLKSIERNNDVPTMMACMVLSPFVLSILTSSSYVILFTPIFPPLPVSILRFLRRRDNPWRPIPARPPGRRACRSSSSTFARASGSVPVMTSVLPASTPSGAAPAAAKSGFSSFTPRDFSVSKVSIFPSAPKRWRLRRLSSRLPVLCPDGLYIHPVKGLEVQEICSEQARPVFPDVRDADGEEELGKGRPL